MDLKLDKKIKLIKRRLLKELPGWESQKKMAVMSINAVTRLAFYPPSNAKLAAAYNEFTFLVCIGVSEICC